MDIFVTTVGSLITLAIAFLGRAFMPWHKINKDEKHRHKVMLQEQNNTEREEIRRMLNTFYGPIKALRKESVILYDLFALSEKSKARAENGYFRTVRFLADGGLEKLEDKDRRLLEQIVEVGCQQLKLIESESCGALSPQLSELFGRLGAHIRVIKMAAEGKLEGCSKEIEDVVFPLEVDGAIEAQIRKLQDDYQRLSYGPNEDDLQEIDSYLKGTIQFYDKTVSKYAEDTDKIDLNDVYRKFRGVGKDKEFIPRGGLILDAGCGTGRDTRYFVKHGFRVVSFDLSEEMVKQCNTYPFAYCKQRSFLDINYYEEFDAVWACASLVHLNEVDFKKALNNLCRALKPGGVFYFSLKAHSNEKDRHGRYFNYFSPEQIQIALSAFDFNTIEEWSNESRKSNDISPWNNFLLRKRMK